MARLRNRHLLTQIRKSARFWPATGVLGLRQSGKSTLLNDLLKLPDHVTLDDQDALEDAQISAKNFLAKLDTPLVIDEAQKVPALFDAIKYNVDGVHYLYPLTLAEATPTLPGPSCARWRTRLRMAKCPLSSISNKALAASDNISRPWRTFSFFRS